MFSLNQLTRSPGAIVTAVYLRDRHCQHKYSQFLIKFLDRGIWFILT